MEMEYDKAKEYVERAIGDLNAAKGLGLRLYDFTDLGLGWFGFGIDADDWDYVRYAIVDGDMWDTERRWRHDSDCGVFRLSLRPGGISDNVRFRLRIAYRILHEAVLKDYR